MCVFCHALFCIAFHAAYLEGANTMADQTRLKDNQLATAQAEGIGGCLDGGTHGVAFAARAAVPAHKPDQRKKEQNTHQ